MKWQKKRCAFHGIMFSCRRNGTKRGGGFSHVAVRSCASRHGESFVGEPRLLRPSITLTLGDREMENGTSKRRAPPVESTLEKRKLALKFQGESTACLPLFHSLFPFDSLSADTVPFHFRYFVTKEIAFSGC